MMADIEKVIKQLEEYKDREFVKEGITIFDSDPRYRKMIIGNTIKLLKEQREQIEALKQTAQSMMEGIVVSQPQIVRCKD